MNAADTDAAILEMAVEDYHGLWEVIWELRGRFPDESPESRKLVALDAIQRLLRADLIQLYLGRDFGGEEQPIPADRVESLLADPLNWEVPAAGPSPHLRIAATKEGEDYVFHEGGAKP